HRPRPRARPGRRVSAKQRRQNKDRNDGDQDKRQKTPKVRRHSATIVAADTRCHTRPHPRPLRAPRAARSKAAQVTVRHPLARELGLAQPQVSKHLRVLRQVGAVDVRENGRQRLYRLNGRALKPIHDWVKEYERTWTERFELIDVVLEELKKRRKEMAVTTN